MKVFYTPRMAVPSGGYSPSAEKPRLAVESWIDKGFAIDVVEPNPVTPDQIALAHDPHYVHGVLSGSRANGHGNRSMAVAESLPHVVGAMVDAAREALTGNNACAPVSGFHHACYDHGGGFCTFNGLMVAALSLDARVGILDCDQHYGDGTDDIIRRLGAPVVHWSVGKRDIDAEVFLLNLRQHMERVFSGCDVLLYQAGADPHVDDPLGGWLTTDQLRQRDEIVFSTATSMGLPVAWCLAGGYQRDAQGGIGPVLKIHDNTMRACLNS